MYPFQPGHQFICHRQNRPSNDFGLLSYLARKPQLAQFCSDMGTLLFIGYYSMACYRSGNGPFGSAEEMIWVCFI
jgi:hypothetical protein